MNVGGVPAMQLSTTQAARELGVSSVYVRKLANEGRIPVEVTPLGRLYDADAVHALAVERSKTPVAKRYATMMEKLRQRQEPDR